MRGQTSPVLRFGPFGADLAARELRKNGVRLKLQDQPFRVLQALLEKPGEVVTREELQERIWGEDTYVDFDKSLSAAIGKVREALDDSRTRPRYIETIPKVGYRFIPPPAPGPSQVTEQPPSRFRYWLAAAGAVAAVGGMIWLLWPPADAWLDPARFQPVPLTASDGSEAFPSFSPDGSQIVFATSSARSTNTAALFLKSLGTEQPRALTDDSGYSNFPAWAPDGSAIAYIRRSEDGCELRLIPPVGGGSRLLRQMTCPIDFTFPHLAWSQDSRHIAYSDKPNPEEPWALFSIEVATRSVERLTQPPAGIHGDDAPSFAWEKDQLTFIRRSSAFHSSAVRQLSLREGVRPAGESRPVSFDRANPGQAVTSVVWDRDDESLFFLSGGLWRAPSRGGRAVRLFTTSARLRALTLSQDGRKLAFSQAQGDADIWSFDRRTGSMEPLITSTYRDWYHSISPDGRQVAWSSGRSGAVQVWVCNLDGSNPVQLTSLPTSNGSPTWSPGGETLAFDTRVNGKGDIYVIAAAGGVPRPLTTHPADDLIPTWSADGATVYFESQRDGELAIWGIDVETGEAARASKARGSWPKASPDGRFLYFRGDIGDFRVFRKDLESGEEIVVLDNVYTFAPTAGGVYYAEWDSGVIRYLDLELGEVQDVVEAKPPIHSIAVSPDEQTILFSQVASGRADIMLIDNIR